METVTQRIDRLEEAMLALVEQSKITQEEIARLSSEMRSFKNEMNKRWGELANKMGTLVEDIFAPSLDLAIEKYFKVKLKDIIQRRIIRKGDKEIEIDLLAYSDDYAFIVEVKSSPDRVGYIDDFIEKLKELPEILQELKKYNIVPIYAGLSLKESTIKYLTKNNIYAMMVRGDILEIVNFKDIEMNK